MNTRALLISALVGGLLIGVLSSIPIVSVVNCLLCGWVWLGGIFAVWMYKRNNAGITPDTGAGAITGALAGLVGALVSSVLSALLTAVGVGASALTPEMMQQMEDAMGEVPAILTSGTAMLLVGVLMTVILYPIFGAIGGLIGAAIFKGR